MKFVIAALLALTTANEVTTNPTHYGDPWPKLRYEC